MSNRISQSYIEDLLARIDIVELIDSRITLRKKGNNYTALCPFHSEKTPSFSVSQSKQFYYCFGCGAHGNAIGFLMQYERLEFMAALETLAAKAGISLPEDEKSQPNAQKITAHYLLLAKVSKLYQTFLKKSPQAIEYFKSRGVTGEIAKQFSLGYAPDQWENLTSYLSNTREIKEQLTATGMMIKKSDHQYYDRFRGRVIFPIRDIRGRTIAFGGRTLGKDLPKYLNSPETPLFHKGSELYGLYEARQACGQLEKIIIVEGYMDVIALAQYGIPYVVATLGTAITPKHIQKLRRYTNEIIFCFDGDMAGEKAAWRALENTLPIMQDGMRISFIFLPAGEDPDTFVRHQGQQAFLNLLTQPMPLSDFFFQQLLQQTDIKTPDGKAKLAALAKTWLDKIPRGIFQELMLQKLASIIQVDVANINRTASAMTPPRSVLRKSSVQVLSPFKLALILLLQNPLLIEAIDDMSFLNTFDHKEAKHLLQLMTILKKNSELSTGALFEHWRDQEDAEYLAQLAAYEYPLSQDGITAEFHGALNRIRDAWQEQLIQTLLEKAKHESLTKAEKLELQRLLGIVKK